MDNVQRKKQLSIAGGFLAALLVLISPVISSVAAVTTNTTINATIGSVISVSSGPSVAISLTPTAGGVVSSASDSVAVSTNNSTGYTLTLANADTTTSLTSAGNTIAAHNGSLALPTALAANTWGYRVVGAGGFGGTAYTGESNVSGSTSTWAGVPANGAADTIKSTATIAATPDTTTVWYGVRANSSQPNGTYSDIVTYTATANS